jgi:hypothetical protein
MDEDEILDGCKDMFDALKGNNPPAEAKRVQELYADQFFSSSSEYKFAVRIGARCALKYRHLIEPPVETSVDAPADAKAHRGNALKQC